MPEILLKEWQSYVDTHPELHLLQSSEWGNLKAAFGWKVVRILHAEVGVQILFRSLPLGFTVGYIPKPAFDYPSLQEDKSFWKEIDSICIKRRAVFCKLEPDTWENNKGIQLPHPWSLSKYNIQPPRTIMIDIHGSEEEILLRMKQKCRYNIRLAEKKGVAVRAWDDIASFHRMLQQTGSRDGFNVHSVEYYKLAFQLFHPRGACELLVAEYEGRPLAALMVFALGSRAWYVYGASSDHERNRMPTYLLQWEAMRWAKAQGCNDYDLWGVPDEDEFLLESEFENRRDGLWGVYRYKRGFGGVIRRAGQAWDRIYIPWLYNLYLKRMAGQDNL